jgi:hypothetical protein
LFAQPPLIDHVGLAISAVSYDGKLGFGFTAGLDRVPDLAGFVHDLVRAFERLVRAAGAAAGAPHGCAA